MGEKIKDTQIVSSFDNIETLGILSQNLKSIAFAISLKKLKKLSFWGGGTNQFNDLPLIENLEELDIWRTRKLEMEHLIPLNKISNLKTLYLRELPRIENFNWLQHPGLETLVIEELKGLNSFDALANNSNLKTLVIKAVINKEKIASLGALTGIETIQVYKEWHLKNHSIDFSTLPNADRIKEMESKYRF